MPTSRVHHSRRSGGHRAANTPERPEARSIRECGSVATSPEIIHGTTPARDLFSFVPASASNHQRFRVIGRLFSTGVFPDTCISYGRRSVGKLCTVVHKPARPRNVSRPRETEIPLRVLARRTHYLLTGRIPGIRTHKALSKNDFEILTGLYSLPSPQCAQHSDSQGEEPTPPVGRWIACSKVPS
jgi:hypothetical protein